MASTYLSRTLGTPTNAYKGTLSYWQKGASTTATNYILACESGSERMLFYLTQGKFQAGLRGTSSPPDIDFTVSGLPRFRDVSAWYHVVLAWDSTQSTASDRMKLYVNGVQYTWSGSGTSGVNDVPQNHVMPMNKSGLPFRIGSTIAGGSYFEGIMSHIHFCDGTQYQASDFGETDSTTGEWKIKTDPSVTYGNNGFWWLKDTNAATDSSPNSNTPTISGTLTKTEDCPSNVFATLNTLCIRTQMIGSSGNISYTNGNNTTSNIDASYSTYNVSTLGMQESGKYYCEFKINAEGSASNSEAFGISNLNNFNNYPFGSSSGYSYNKDGSGTPSGSGFPSYTTNDIIGVAFDTGNGNLWFSKNGTWINNATISEIGSGDNTNAVFTGISTSETWHFSGTTYDNGGFSANFGNGYFGTTAVSSAGTNASGNGIFEYDVPTGFTALSTKGLNL
jgi:hypothetical protein